MERIWLKNYPEGAPDDIDADTYSSIACLFEESCEKFANKPAYHNFGRTITFKELDDYSRNFAAFLQSELKLCKGERVAIMLPNILQYPIAMLGILRAGLIVINVNPLYTSRELEHQLKDSGAKTIIVLENFAETVTEALEDIEIDNIIITQIGDLLSFPKSVIFNFVLKYIERMVPKHNLKNTTSFNAALNLGKKSQFIRPDIQSSDIAFLQYTGGTTGVAKGAMLSHRNIIANVLQIVLFYKNTFIIGKETFITALPLYHIYSLTCNCLSNLYLGGLNVLITNPRDIKGFLKELKKWPFTFISGVNTLFQAMLKHPDFKTVDFSHLHLCTGGGMAVQQVVAENWLKATEKPISQGYGLTESSPCITGSPKEDVIFKNSIGLPFPSTEISIRDDEGNELPIGEAGELCAKGPQVMLGYWQREEATQDTFTSDGYLKTGDIAKFDEEGYLYIVDRKKDMIIVSGFNVYPNEIEDVVASHPDVDEVACIGIPDSKSTEAVKIFVVKKPGTNPTIESLREYCKEHLTAYKVPKHVEFRDDLPKSNVGKILRRELRDKT